MVNLSYEGILKILMLILQETYSMQNEESNPNEFNFTELILENLNAPTYTDPCPLRIAGGIDADITVVPYQVALKRPILNGSYWYTFCGGTIVTLKFVLGAAHCFVIPEFKKFKDDVRAVAGTVKPEVNVFTLLAEHWRKIKHYYYHEKFILSTLKNDIALLELEEEFIESKKVKPIRMHSPTTQVMLSTGTNCVISGYGKNALNQRIKTLQMTCVPIIPHVNCSRFYGTQFVTSTVFCAGIRNKDSCEGDSGGPIVCRGILVGIISWGKVCGRHPGVYTRLISYTSTQSVSFTRLQDKNTKKVEERIGTSQTIQSTSNVLLIVCIILILNEIK